MTGDARAQTTVVLPVWDQYADDRLVAAIASLRQQGAAVPIVVVDNASRVELPSLPGVRVVRAATRLPLGEARNLGLAQVTTPHVVVWDADDLMLPGTVSFLEQAIEADPRLAAFAMAIREEPSGRRHRWPRRSVRWLMRAPRAFALLDSIWSLYPSTGATIMRTELVHAAGGYAGAESGEDWCLGVSLAFRGRIGWSERPGRIYRIHDESVWARSMTAAHQRRHARDVRERIRGDPAIPGWARLMLPVIEAGQYAAIALHSGIAGLRRAGLVRRGTTR